MYIQVNENTEKIRTGKIIHNIYILLASESQMNI